MQTPDIGNGLPPGLNWILYNRKGIRSGWRLLVWAGLSLGSLFVFAIVLAVALRASGITGHKTSEPPVWPMFGLYWILFAIIFAPALLVATKIERRPIASLGLGFHSRWRQELLQGIAWGVGLMIAAMLLLVCVGGYRIHGFHEGLLPALGWGTLMAVGFIGVGLTL